jgi:SAM-dependent methyltransferase
MTDPHNPNPASDLRLAAYLLGKSPDQTRREADYIEMLLNAPVPAHLLDVPCGAGRLAVELAARGHRVTGLDIEPALIDEALRHAAAQGVRESVRVEPRDMRDLPWQNTFDGAYCFWESFGFFDDEGNRAFLAAVAGALKPGGRFVFDTHVMETMLPHLGPRTWNRVIDPTGGGDLLVLEDHAYDHVRATLTRHLMLIRAGQTAQTTITTRLYGYRELVALLESAGFTACEGYTWLSLVPFMIGAPRLVMVAQRADAPSV